MPRFLTSTSAFVHDVWLGMPCSPFASRKELMAGTGIGIGNKRRCMHSFNAALFPDTASYLPCE